MLRPPLAGAPPAGPSTGPDGSQPRPQPWATLNARRLGNGLLAARRTQPCAMHGSTKNCELLTLRTRDRDTTAFGSPRDEENRRAFLEKEEGTTMEATRSLGLEKFVF
ncbi:hypothetical protein F511_44305 [Dorcoceras hygrometricum]|uniref:Uncharacterized protein n=1 Tax=Dorcoceras hygrometricum TaxID=472368 RepID=A0A2Z7DBD2_9LAMI|nr:hypothetical protein F511_44305 [Dorcoceras hygrometricum]